MKRYILTLGSSCSLFGLRQFAIVCRMPQPYSLIHGMRPKVDNDFNIFRCLFLGPGSLGDFRPPEILQRNATPQKN